MGDSLEESTSREAIQKQYEETGGTENTQLMQMFSYQTDREFRIMMGTDIRIPRDPLAIRMREDQIKESVLIRSTASLWICCFLLIFKQEFAVCKFLAFRLFLGSRSIVG